MNLLKLIFCFWGMSFGFLQACENRVFDLELQDFGVKIYEVLGEFANECSFSVVLDDEAAKSHLDRELTMVNFKGKDLNFVFDLLFRLFSYSNRRKATIDLLIFSICFFSL